MKVRHIRHKPWLTKGPEYRAFKRQIQAARRIAERRYAEVREACLYHMRQL
jgi:hypothetical protein